ncbi:ankyrin repeat domain-containing protein [bacterium]|nr:ankyrin repeat domain-containing protein [bacterium]
MCRAPILLLGAVLPLLLITQISRAADAEPPLIAAAREGKLKLALSLIERGAEVEAVGEQGWRALHVAAHGGHVEMVWLLLAVGAQPSK